LGQTVLSVPASAADPRADWRAAVAAVPAQRYTVDARGYAGAVAYALQQETVAPHELVEAQYAGKESLRPILDAVRKAIPRGAEEAARKTYVTWSHGRQFALVQPSTKTRADLGLVLEGVRAGARLEASGSFGSGRITHRVALGSPREVDAEVKRWMRDAFDAAAR